jgi:hypothetical protein
MKSNASPGMLGLAGLEALLYRLITAPRGVEEGLANEKSFRAAGLESIICGDDRLSAKERVEIYANAYFYRLLDVLKEDFPATLAVLGDVNFHNLITGYLIEYPPTEPSIFYAGRHLQDFLRTHPMRDQSPFLADLAGLERTTLEVFHGPEAQSLDAAGMREVPPQDWPAMTLRTHPAARIMDLGWCVDTLLRAVENNEAWEPSAPGPASILVWRQNSRVYYRQLESGERTALGLAQNGATFAAICDAIVAETAECDDFAALINQLLARWLSDGVLTQAHS